MATISVNEENLVIEMHGLDKFWALRSTLSVPLAHLKSVEARPKDAHVSNMKGALRVGSYVPGYVLAGYYYIGGGLGPNAAALFQGLAGATQAVEAWPEPSGTPAAPSQRARALEHLASATAAMRAAAAELGVEPNDPGKGWAFYELHDPEKTIGLDVAGEKIRRIVIEVEGHTPDDAVALIEAARQKR